jgi:hypothetical protein
MIPQPTGTVSLHFDRFEKKYGPYIIQINSELSLEFDDHSCQTITKLHYHRDGRKITLEASPSGIAPIGISVTIKAGQLPDTYTLYSKRNSQLELSKKNNQTVTKGVGDPAIP